MSVSARSVAAAIDEPVAPTEANGALLSPTVGAGVLGALVVIEAVIGWMVLS